MRPDLAYALARLRARIGERADESQWHALEASRTAAQFLALTQSGALARWTGGLMDAADPARSESHLHARWQQQADEVAHWLPARWRAAVRRFGALPLLPWQSDAGDDTLDGWSRAFADALPTDADPRLPWRRPAELLLPRLAGDPAGRCARPAAAAAALHRLYRRHADTALAVFAGLALAALDLERLRGGLVARALFEAESG